MLCVNSILNQSLLRTGTLAVSKLGAETLQRLSLIATARRARHSRTASTDRTSNLIVLADIFGWKNQRFCSFGYFWHLTFVCSQVGKKRGKGEVGLLLFFSKKFKDEKLFSLTTVAHDKSDKIFILFLKTVK